MPLRKIFAAPLALGLIALAVTCTGLPGLPPPDGGVDGSAGGKDAGKDSGTGGGQGGGSGGLQVESACGALSNARCQYYLRCGLVGPTQLQDCVNYLAATWCGSKYRWSPFVKANTLAYDGVYAQRCADAFAGRACTDWESLPTDCGKILSPNLNVNQRCYGQ